MVDYHMTKIYPEMRLHLVLKNQKKNNRIWNLAFDIETKWLAFILYLKTAVTLQKLY